MSDIILVEIKVALVLLIQPIKIFPEITRLSIIDLIVIDDFAFKKLNQQASEYFYTIVDSRFLIGSFIITNNKSIGNWPSVLPDPIIANTIMDRKSHNTQMIIIKGESYRKK